MSLFSTFRKPVNVAFDEFRSYDGELSTNPIAATDVPGPNQALSTGNPPIIPTTTPTSPALTWPLAFASFKLQTRTNLVWGGWLNVTSPTPTYDKCHIVPAGNLEGQFRR